MGSKCVHGGLFVSRPSIGADLSLPAATLSDAGHLTQRTGKFRLPLPSSLNKASPEQGDQRQPGRVVAMPSHAARYDRPLQDVLDARCLPPTTPCISLHKKKKKKKKKKSTCVDTTA